MSNPEPGQNLGYLPLIPEIWHHICSHLSKPNLSRLRLVASPLNEIAMHHIYKSIRVEAIEDSVQSFVSIAKSPRLRDLVREVTIDTWIGPDFAYHANEDYMLPVAFMQALPYLRAFKNTAHLHLRFSEHCGDVSDWGYDIEETFEFRYRVLDTICHCVAGMWTIQRQQTIDQVLEPDNWSFEDEEKEFPFEYIDEDLGVPDDQAFQLKELTISNLADNYDHNLYSSEAWLKVISLPSLIDLKLLVVTEVDDASPERAVFCRYKYSFFESLSSGWLKSNLAQNLKVLSLYYRSYWGWFPKPDLRNIELPQLKILALGNFVLSHEWEIDWFASLGKENGSGGLEELYLDDCPILFEARQRGPLNSQPGYPGYPNLGQVLDRDGHCSNYEFPLRWHHVLSHWAESMKGIRLFCMGYSDWDTDKAHYNYNDEQMTIYDGHDTDKLSHRLSHNLHRIFPGYDVCRGLDEDTYRGSISKELLYGNGMHKSRGGQMQYISYDMGIGPDQYCEMISYRENDTGYEPEEGTGSKDDSAYEALMAAVKARLEKGRR